MRNRLSLSVALLASLLAGLLLTGCGGTDSGSDGGSGSSDYGSSSSSSEPGGPSVSSTDPSGKSSPGITITGTPTEGVENGCIVMQSGATLYLLLGGDRSVLMSGQPVVVRGVPDPGLMTTCQQGTPFRVTEVKPA
ncbi:hypothetical protein Vau01_051970 [Virgisporangium aurantiacum]|uniref:Lipoprotein n=1 Tax=Virgisporangium aurantiacum TaxID=175570 RepID=A0A8J3Z9K9_9ACTN|nr:hypothetical protein Vau01_051970 [Virgisporangium aurantiacum]